MDHRDFLFRLLDDIDTLDDACRNNDALFRERVRAVHRRRFEVVDTDGYSKTWKDEVPAVEDHPAKDLIGYAGLTTPEVASKE